ncbi:MAG: hemerythrin domain-containing protein [Chloroflexota bacterium]
MPSITQAAHEHHDRLMPHVDALARLAAELGDTAPDGFAAACEAEHRFITGQLLPHIDAIETTLYDDLERLMAGRHSMAPMRAEHAELRRLIDSMGQYHDLVAEGRLGTPEVIGLRRALYRLHSLLRVHLAEEELYLRVLEQNLSAEEIEALARGIDHAVAEPL